jgi:hypothetical protein
MAGFNASASSCTLQNLIGTGTDDCDLGTLGDLIGGAITTKDVKFNIATDVFLTAYKENVKKKKVFPLIGLYNFEQSTPDNEMATSSIGIKFEIREGKVELSLTFNKSHCAHKAIFTKKAFKKWNIILFFNNHVVGAKSLNGQFFKGFDCGMLSVGTFKVQQGTDPQMTKVTMQLTQEGTTEWNQRMTAVSNEEVNAELNSLDGVIETDILFASTNLTAGTSIVVDVKSQCNGSAKSGLTDSNNWTLAGTQAAATAVSTVVESLTIPGRYTVTLTVAVAAGDTVQLRLGTPLIPVVEDILGVMYSGISAVKVVS